MEYQLIESPYPIYFNFRNLFKGQAKEYFQWYVASIPSRVANLATYIHKSGGDSINLDYSTKSLIPLWEWFEPQIEWVMLTKEEQSQIVEGMNERQKQMMLSQRNDRLSDHTEKVIFDIAAYYAEVFLKNNSQLHWGYNKSSKLNAYYNKPALYGFPRGTECIETRQLVHVASVKSSRELCKMRLYDLYFIRISELS